MRDGCVVDPAWKCASVDETMNNCDDVLDDLPMYLQDVLYDAAGLCSAERGIPHGSGLCHARGPIAYYVMVLTCVYFFYITISIQNLSSPLKESYSSFRK